MTETASYRRLGRNGSSLFQRVRSVSTFMLLVVVVVCVFLAYQYMNNSAELSTFRAEIEQSNMLNVKLNNDMLELNLKLEQLKQTEQQCRNRMEETNKKFKVCQLQNENNAKLAANAERMDQVQNNLDATKIEMELQQHRHANEIATLTQTIEQLRAELAAIHQNSTEVYTTDTATKSVTDQRSRQQLTAPTTTNSSSNAISGEQRAIVAGGEVTLTAHSETNKMAKAKHLRNDAHERLDESEVQQRHQQQKEEFVDKDNENLKQQKSLPIVGERRAHPEISGDGAEKEAHKQLDNEKEDSDEEQEEAKADGEVDEHLKESKPEQQQHLADALGEDHSKEVNPGAIEAPLINIDEKDDQQQ